MNWLSDADDSVTGRLIRLHIEECGVNGGIHRSDENMLGNCCRNSGRYTNLSVLDQGITCTEQQKKRRMNTRYQHGR